jgi:FkbM family methyltransferase
MIKRYREAKRARRKKAAVERFDARAVFAEEAAEKCAYVGVDTNHGSYIVFASDVQVGRSLFVKESRPEFRVLERAVAVHNALTGEDGTKDSQFVDVGANIGTEVIPALTRHGFRDAVAIEPDAENYRLLCANLALNGIASRVTSLDVAASDKQGVANLTRQVSAGGLSFIGDAAEEGQERIEVRTVTLDQLVDEGTIDAANAGMLWVDVEGHEAQVLAGADQLTASGVPTLVEYHPLSLSERGDLDLFESIATDRYTHLVDARRAQVTPEACRPIADLAAITEARCDPNRAPFTDLLLLRLSH